jgi:hypothetical protein
MLFSSRRIKFSFVPDMKKLFAIMLLLVYGFSSTGMTLHLHYCCGKLDAIDLSPVKDEHCGGKHKLIKKSCCDEKQVSLKLKSEQNPAKFLNPVFQLPAIKTVQPDFFVLSPVQSKKLLPEVFAPPPLQKNINSLFCVYRI